jgi:exopolyphosphatase / guanosine-5'-triphosphate,3'-diphosphate pyrophosphatase
VATYHPFHPHSEAFMGEIIPRWEWRTFGSGSFGESEDLIRGKCQAQVRKSGEVYVLSSQSTNNTKVRDDLMDIKTLKAVNADRLEQWNPILKAAFPLTPAVLADVFVALSVPLPALARESYTLAQALDELVRPQPALRVVQVAKERHGFTIDGCIVEIAEVAFDGVPFRTVAVEQEDPERVIATVRALRLERFENINYLRAMKSAVGMS